MTGKFKDDRVIISSVNKEMRDVLDYDIKTAACLKTTYRGKVYLPDIAAIMGKESWAKRKSLSTGIHLVAGPNMSHAEDTAAFVIAVSDQLVMIDSGAGRSTPSIPDNIRSAGCSPERS